MNTLIDDYIEYRVARGEFAESTAYVTRYTLRHFARVAGADPSAWTEQDVVEFCDPTLRANTRKVRLMRVRQFARWLIRAGVLDTDPTADVPSPRELHAAPRDIEPDGVTRLLAAVPDARGVVIVMLMVQCGLRCSDVSRVRVEDIDVARQVLHVRAKGGRGERTHSVPVPGEAWDVLVAWVRSLGRTAGPVVTSKHDPTVALQGHTISKLVRGWMRDAGLKTLPWDGCSAHALRHSCAQHMIDHGAELRDVQHALGHASVRTTELYVRREPVGLREAMEGRHYLDAA